MLHADVCNSTQMCEYCTLRDLNGVHQALSTFVLLHNFLLQSVPQMKRGICKEIRIPSLLSDFKCIPPQISPMID